MNFSDEAKNVAAVGKVRSFSDVNLAQQFIQEHDFPLVGGYSSKVKVSLFCLKF